MNTRIILISGISLIMLIIIIVVVVLLNKKSKSSSSPSATKPTPTRTLFPNVNINTIPVAVSTLPYSLPTSPTIPEGVRKTQPNITSPGKQIESEKTKLIDLKDSSAINYVRLTTGDGFYIPSFTVENSGGDYWLTNISNYDITNVAIYLTHKPVADTSVITPYLIVPGSNIAYPLDYKLMERDKNGMSLFAAYNTNTLMRPGQWIQVTVPGGSNLDFQSINVSTVPSSSPLPTQHKTISLGNFRRNPYLSLLANGKITEYVTSVSVKGTCVVTNIHTGIVYAIAISGSVSPPSGEITEGMVSITTPNGNIINDNKLFNFTKYENEAEGSFMFRFDLFHTLKPGEKISITFNRTGNISLNSVTI